MLSMPRVNAAVMRHSLFVFIGIPEEYMPGSVIGRINIPIHVTVT